jgi:hypothetical protein
MTPELCQAWDEFPTASASFTSVISKEVIGKSGLYIVEHLTLIHRVFLLPRQSLSFLASCLCLCQYSSLKKCVGFL